LDPDEQLDVANSDPLNLAGIILPGPRVSTLSRTLLGPVPAAIALSDRVAP
jgi:hypothetical protein